MTYIESDMNHMATSFARGIIVRAPHIANTGAAPRFQQATQAADGKAASRALNGRRSLSQIVTPTEIKTLPVRKTGRRPN